MAASETIATTDIIRRASYRLHQRHVNVTEDGPTTDSFCRDLLHATMDKQSNEYGGANTEYGTDAKTEDWATTHPHERAK